MGGCNSMRAGIDDKELLALSLLRYTQRHQCRPAGFPTSVLLGKKASCEAFFRENHRWAEPDSLWFVKAANGSLGRHIRLLRGRDVRALAANGSFSCPMHNRVAR